MQRESGNSSDLCAALAFYGIRHSPEAVGGFYQEVTEAFAGVGSPMRVQGMRRDGRRGRVSKRVIADGFEGVRSLELRSVEAGAEDEPTTRTQEALWLPEVAADQENPRTLAVVWAPVGIADLDSPAFRGLAERLVAWCRPAYGIGYRRERRFGPGYYAFSFVYQTRATPPDVDGDHLGAWRLGLEAATYECGELRWVYPVNYLNPAQLSRAVNGTTLREWVMAAPGRGSLRALEGLTEWAVPDGAMGGVRAALDGAGLTFNRERFLRSVRS